MVGYGKVWCVKQWIRSKQWFDSLRNRKCIKYKKKNKCGAKRVQSRASLILNTTFPCTKAGATRRKKKSKGPCYASILLYCYAAMLLCCYAAMLLCCYAYQRGSWREEKVNPQKNISSNLAILVISLVYLKIKYKGNIDLIKNIRSIIVCPKKEPYTNLFFTP